MQHGESVDLEEEGVVEAYRQLVRERFSGSGKDIAVAALNMRYLLRAEKLYGASSVENRTFARAGILELPSTEWPNVVTLARNDHVLMEDPVYGKLIELERKSQWVADEDLDLAADAVWPALNGLARDLFYRRNAAAYRRLGVGDYASIRKAVDIVERHAPEHLPKGFAARWE